MKVGLNVAEMNRGFGHIRCQRRKQSSCKGQRKKSICQLDDTVSGLNFLKLGAWKKDWQHHHLITMHFLPSIDYIYRNSWVLMPSTCSQPPFIKNKGIKFQIGIALRVSSVN